MRKMIKNIDKNNIKEYKNIINSDFLIKNKLINKKINRNKIVKVANITFNNGENIDVYDKIRTTKNNINEDTNKYIKLFSLKVENLLS